MAVQAKEEVAYLLLLLLTKAGGRRQEAKERITKYPSKSGFGTIWDEMNYNAATIKRAERAFFCSPFSLKLFSQMRDQSVPLPTIAGQFGWQEGYTKQPLAEQKIEKELMWLIQVGLLRREVDGQGITDSFRLTPLGRQLLENWEIHNKELPTASAKEQLLNILSRWLRLPF